MTLTPDDRRILKEVVYEMSPEEGTSIGNYALMAACRADPKLASIPFDDDDYWDVRNELVEEKKLEKGQGRGGSVFRPQTAATPLLVAIASEGTTSEPESSLYDPFLGTLATTWVQDKALDNCVIEKTAMQGRRETGGRWTRPDIVVVAVRSYEYWPNKVLEVTSFEIKPMDWLDITGVFEAAAHTAFAHRAILAVQVSNSATRSPELERLTTECRRFGIGLMLFQDPAKFASWDVLLEPERHDPDPEQVNAFIQRQIAEENRTRLLRWLR